MRTPLDLEDESLTAIREDSAAHQVGLSVAANELIHRGRQYWPRTRSAMDCRCIKRWPISRGSRRAG